MGIRENYDHIASELKKIRPENPPVIITVSKKQPVTKIQDALEHGLTIFGENQIKEGIEKFTPLFDSFPKIELHHIGPVQTGTLKKLFGIFSYTHGVGSESTLRELVKQSVSRKKKIGYFLQANLTEEDTKSGFERKDLLDVLKRINDFQTEFTFLAGLMTMGPTNEDKTETRRVFAELKKIRDEFCPGKKLSMGMSGDFQIAAEEGTDFVRIGTAIFGERNYQ